MIRGTRIYMAKETMRSTISQTWKKYYIVIIFHIMALTLLPVGYGLDVYIENCHAEFDTPSMVSEYCTSQSSTIKLIIFPIIFSPWIVAIILAHFSTSIKQYTSTQNE